MKTNGRWMTALLGAAFSLGLSQCGGSGEPSTIGSVEQAITNQWFQVNFNAYQQGNLNGQDGWHPLQVGDLSPNVVGPVDEGTYHHFNVAKMVNKGATSSAQRNITAAMSAQGKHICVLQARVNENVPANDQNKARFSFNDDDNAAVAKFNFSGNGILFIGGTYQHPVTAPLFPGDNGEPFERVWYRLVVTFDYDAGTVAAEVGKVGNPDVITATGPLALQPEAIASLAMTEFGRPGIDGAVLIDNILCYPQQ
jgi:hypothetical protein